MASDRATALADDFSAANAEAMDFVRRCTAAEWTLTVPGEEWPVGVVLHHIAVGHGHGARWLHDMASGEGVTETAEGCSGCSFGSRMWERIGSEAVNYCTDFDGSEPP